MMESPPASALKMTQADFLFEFLVVTFNAPPKLCCVYQLFKGNSCLQVGEPVFGGFRVPLGPRGSKTSSVKKQLRLPDNPGSS